MLILQVGKPIAEAPELSSSSKHSNSIVTQTGWDVGVGVAVGDGVGVGDCVGLRDAVGVGENVGAAVATGVLDGVISGVGPSAGVAVDMGDDVPVGVATQYDADAVIERDEFLLAEETVEGISADAWLKQKSSAATIAEMTTIFEVSLLIMNRPYANDISHNTKRYSSAAMRQEETRKLSPRNRFKRLERFFLKGVLYSLRRR